MKSKQMMLFAVAIGCGLVAMVGAQQILSGNKPEVREQVKILTSRVDIEPGVKLDKTNVAFKDWPVDALPEGAITKEEEYADHALRHRVTANSPILTRELGAKGSYGVNSMIPKGMQVVPLSVDAVLTHGGLLQAGSFVEITCSITRQSQPGQPPKQIIRNVLKRVQVFAVGNNTSAGDGGPKDGNSSEVKVISFVVFPNQAKLLNYAKVVSEGKVYIAMLGETGDSKEEIRDFDEESYAAAANDLLGDKAPDPFSNANAPATNANPALQQDQRATGSSFAEYVKKQPGMADVAELGKKPTQPTWKIEIWTGKEKKVHEFALPVRELSETNEPELPTLGTQWTAPIMQFFNTRRKSKKAVVEETRSEPVEKAIPDLPNDKSAESPADTVRK